MAAPSSSCTDGSDIADDFPCSSCEKDNKQMESVKYCLECKDYLCRTCLSYHSKFSSTANHTVIDKSNILVPKENIAEVDIGFVSSDVKTPYDVPGICLVTRAFDRFAIPSDWRNRSVKVLSMRDLKIVQSVALKEKPYGIAELPSSGLIVVTARDSDELTVFEFSGQQPVLKIAQMSPVKHFLWSRGVAVVQEHFNDSVIVINGSTGNGQASLNIFGTAVKHADTSETTVAFCPIYSKKLDKDTFLANPQNVVLSKDLTRLYITNEQLGVIVTDMKGKKIGTLKKHLLKGARGICVDNNGNIYVAGKMSDNVVKFSPDEKFIGEIVNSSHGLKCPISLCYDLYTHSLLVGCRGTSMLTIVKL